MSFAMEQILDALGVHKHDLHSDDLLGCDSLLTLAVLKVASRIELGASDLGEALEDIRVQLRRVADALQGTMAQRSGPVALRVTVENDTTDQGGAMQEFASNDAQRLSVDGFTPSVVDQGGVPITKADGTPLQPSDLGVAWSTDNTAVADTSRLTPAGGKIGSVAPGRAIITAAIGPYPDGSTKQYSFGWTIGASAPGDPTLNVTVEDENQAA